MTSELVVRSHPRCLGHRPPPGHPDGPDRLLSVLDALRPSAADPWSLETEATLPPDETTLGALRWIHDGAHIERLRTACARAPTSMDSDDCAVSAGSFDAAVAAAGLTLAAALDLVNRRRERLFLALRPPGHHAERDRARGFCFFNHAVLAAEVVARAWSAPVLIVDLDVTHGSGIQSMIAGRSDLGLVSIHRYPFFPGSGAGDDIGQGAGAGLVRNVPLAAGSGDEEHVAALALALPEVAARLRPAALVVSAGFGSLAGDPIGGMAVTPDGFRRLSEIVVETAHRFAGGRVLSVLEGGFHPHCLGACARAHVEALGARTA